MWFRWENGGAWPNGNIVAHGETVEEARARAHKELKYPLQILDIIDSEEPEVMVIKETT